MFEAIISDVKMLRDSIDTISQIIDEAVLKVKADGLELLAADRAMVSVVEFKLSSKAFDSYNYTEDANIGLNLLNFLSVLKRAGNNDKVTLKLDENKLGLVFKGESRRAFKIPLIDIKREEIPAIGQFDFPAKVEVNAGILISGIDDANIFADSVIIEVSPESFIMSAEADNNRSELKLEKGNVGLLNLSAMSHVKSRYPLDYMKKMIKASKLVNIARIQMGNDYPMKMDFIGDNVQMGFVLAPRVQED
ncbi:MAG: proliferating cell nuclear antigen (pcna) [Candidatus Aenigmarchaeota archaeon]|nr:proliferating cell nuclear antigen (pcna) [Candidatus Aenigmarchaeota archaeon]